MANLPNLPTFNPDNEPKGRTVLPEGEYDVSLAEASYKSTMSGYDMVLVKFIVDNDEQHMGAAIETNFLFGHEKGFGEQQFQGFANRCRKADGSLDPTPQLPKGGWQWPTDVNSWDEFAAAFVQLPPLRTRVKVVHTYDVQAEEGGPWENRVEKERFEEVRKAGGKAYIKYKVFYQTPPNGPALTNVVTKAAAAKQAPAAFPGQAPAQQAPFQTGQTHQPAQVAVAPAAEPAGFDHF